MKSQAQSVNETERQKAKAIAKAIGGSKARAARLKLLASVRRTVSMGVERVGWTDKVKRGTDDERA